MTIRPLGPLLIGVPLLGLGCLPIPVKRDVLIRPQGTLTVVDAAGDPVPGAEVTVRRYQLGPPPEFVTHRWMAPTDGSGQAYFVLDVGRETVMPLMMHGVPQYAWQVCAEHPDHAGAWSEWLVQLPSEDPQVDGTSVPTLQLGLGPGAGEPCDWRVIPDSQYGVVEDWAIER